MSNWLYKDPKGQRVIASYDKTQNTLKFPHAVMRPIDADLAGFEFLQRVSEERAKQIKLAETRVRLGRTRTRPIYRRNLNGFNVIVGYEKY